MACLGASRDAGVYIECAIANGGQQVRHCLNLESGTSWIKETHRYEVSYSPSVYMK